MPDERTISISVKPGGNNFDLSFTVTPNNDILKWGLSIDMVRPLLMVDLRSKDALNNWWTYLYGNDIVVSPIWEKEKREQQVYLPTGQKWKDAWSGKAYDGGQTLTVKARNGSK